jgi:hydroxyacid-oxoacid transhydrogenase
MGCQYFAPCDDGADTFTINIPKMTFGRNSLKEAGVRAAALGMSRIALFTGPWLKDSQYVATVV